MAQGDAAQVNDLVGLIPPDNPPYQPAGESDQFLFSPTDRPAEPFTQGLPFGPGHGPEMTNDNPELEIQKVAIQALQDPHAPKELKQFAARVQQGM